MVSEPHPRWLRPFVIFVGLIFLFACASSTYTYAEAHHTTGLCQGVSKDGYSWPEKFQGLPALITPHEPAGSDVYVEKVSLPQQEAPPSHDLWDSLFSHSPPHA